MKLIEIIVLKLKNRALQNLSTFSKKILSFRDKIEIE